MASFYEEIQKSSIADERENAQSRVSVDKWIFRLLLILIGFMPIIVLAKVVDVTSPLISSIGELSSGGKGDLFTYYKSLLVIAITVIAGVMLLVKVLFMGGTIRKTVINYVLGIFAFAIVMSTILSPNITIALNGQYNRSDGAISWLCYIALLFIAMNIDYPKKALNYILYSLYPFVLINLFIMAMNFYGKDLLQKSTVQKVVSSFLPEGANISAGSTLVGTLNQWNYMSGMFAMMAVLFLAAALFGKNIVHNIGHIVMALASIAIVFMSLSTSGFLTFVALLPVLILAIFKTSNKKQSILLLVTFLVLSLPVFHTLAKHMPDIWNETVGIVLKNNPYSVETKDEQTSYDFELNTMLSTKAYAAKAFELPVLPDRATAAGSGRLYIWEKTMDLVKEKPLFGYGLDSIMYNFPHYNIDARAGLSEENMITDKAHNVYVSLLYGTGFIGLASMLALIIISIGMLLRAVIKNNSAPIFILGIAWVAYLIQALFNDSLPGITAVAFIFAGIMLAMVLQSKEQNDGRYN